MLNRESQRASELIGELFDAASDLPPEQRARYLDVHLDPSRASDLAIRSEVERLLLHHDRSGLLDKSLISSAPLPADSQPALEPGEVVSGRFRIQRMIGLGGMGEVYEAEDLKTRQTVALKTIRVDMAADAAQTERFRRELLIARNIAHRNVCKVFDYDDIDRGAKGRLLFFTMELLRGETLAQRLLASGRLSQVDALPILEQVAAGLEEVHRSGIIHRDLKPSNIFLVQEGNERERAVVMDFGLARNLTEADLRQTCPGMVMGTRLYMPPELPKAAGIFSDVYSFGVVALEMVTGSPSPIVAPRSVVPSLDPAWDKALLACFNLDTTKRPASILDVVAMLRRRTRRWRKAVFAAGIASVCVAAASAIWGIVNPPPAPTTAPVPITTDPGVTVNPTSTADGKYLAFASDYNSPGDLNIWVQNVETGERRQITTDPYDDDEPTLSPDGQLIAWRTGRESILNIRSTADGAIRPLAKNALAPRFSPDGRYIAYWTGVDGERTVPGRAWIVPAAGGPPREIAPGFADARLPGWSPDGKNLLFRGVREPAASLEDSQDWWTAPLSGGSIRSTGIGPRLRTANLQPHDSPALWNRSSLIFAARSGYGINLFSIGIYPVIGAVGAARALTTDGGLQDEPAILTRGRIAYADWHEQVHIFRIDLSSGALTQVTFKETNDSKVSSSADGLTLAFGRREGMVRKIWMKDLSRGLAEAPETPLIEKGLALPVISSDGRTVAFSSGSSIWLIDATTRVELLECSDCGELRGWVPHSHEVLYLQRTLGSPPAIRVLDLVSKSKRTLLSAPGIDEASVSPDGRTVAFAVRSNFGHSAIFIARMTANGATPESERITAEDGAAYRPVWSPDGKTLYYVSDRDGFLCIWSHKLDTLHLRVLGDPQPVFHFHKAGATLSNLSPATFGLSRGGNGLFVSVSVTRANIWALHL